MYVPLSDSMFKLLTYPSDCNWLVTIFLVSFIRHGRRVNYSPSRRQACVFMKKISVAAVHYTTMCQQSAHFSFFSTRATRVVGSEELRQPMPPSRCNRATCRLCACCADLSICYSSFGPFALPVPTQTTDTIQHPYVCPELSVRTQLFSDFH